MVSVAAARHEDRRDALAAGITPNAVCPIHHQYDRYHDHVLLALHKTACTGTQAGVGTDAHAHRR